MPFASSGCARSICESITATTTSLPVAILCTSASLSLLAAYCSPLAADAGQEPASAEQNAANGEQYAANKLKLAEVHKIATGKDVVVAVIDSQIDSAHPELAKGIAESFDAVGRADQPHTHGTGMAGAIVAQDRLMGVAPGAHTLAIHAFAT